MSFRRNDSSTAFFSHWLTVQPPSPFSATRTSPLSSRSSVFSTASRTTPVVPAEMPWRSSHTASIALCNSAVFTF